MNTIQNIDLTPQPIRGSVNLQDTEKVNIKLTDGRWWINGKKHKFCNAWEQFLFNSFLRFIRSEIDNGSINKNNQTEYLNYSFCAFHAGCVDVLHINTGKKIIIKVLNAKKVCLLDN